MSSPDIARLSTVLENILRLFLKHVRMELQEQQNLTWGEHRSLMLIGQLEGISQVELGRELGIKPISILRRVDKLEKLGYVKRVRYRADRRVNQLYLTASGQAVRDQAAEIGIRLLMHCLPNVETVELDKILHGLAKLEQGLVQLDTST